MPPIVVMKATGSVVEVTLNRPEVHNALNPELLAALRDAIQDAAAQPGCRAVVLTGEGSTFCAGADLRWMTATAEMTPEQRLADTRVLAEALRAVALCPVPVIARVHGHAYGGGAGLVAACDLVVADAKAKFRFSEARLGLIPAVITPVVLRRLSRAAARRYFMTAESIDATEAWRIGLVDEIVEEEAELDVQVQAWTEEICRNGPLAVAGCKLLVEDLTEEEWNATLEKACHELARRRESAEAREGMRAFLEKREPNWGKDEG